MKRNMKQKLQICGSVTNTYQEEEKTLLPPEASKVQDEAEAITPEKLAAIQDEADELDVLLPTGFNQVIPRKYADDDEVLLPPFKK